jgi:hypothetical protein
MRLSRSHIISIHVPIRPKTPVGQSVLTAVEYRRIA